MEGRCFHNNTLQNKLMMIYTTETFSADMHWFLPIRQPSVFELYHFYHTGNCLSRLYVVEIRYIWNSGVDFLRFQPLKITFLVWDNVPLPAWSRFIETVVCTMQSLLYVYLYNLCNFKVSWSLHKEVLLYCRHPSYLGAVRYISWFIDPDMVLCDLQNCLLCYTSGQSTKHSIDECILETFKISQGSVISFRQFYL